MAIPISKFASFAIVSVLLLQGAAATWYTGTTFEPDNGEDDPAFMQTEAPGLATNLIYFNAVTGVYGVTPIVNHNVGLLETSIRAANLEYHTAMLGVWVDCNGDGYVGMAAGALREYPATLLADTTVCPPITGAANVWTAGAHNYNGWVSEFVPIGDQSTADRRTYPDVDAKVWGDYNRPTDPSLGAGTCALAPQPRGTYQSTGGLVNWLDCGNGVMEAWNGVWQGQRLLAQDIPGLNDFGIDLGLDFDDPNNASGTWIDRPTFGTEDTAYSPAYVYDCSAAPIRSGDVLNATPAGPLVPNAAHNVEAYVVDPTVNDGVAPSQWTLPALVNHTNEGTLDDCDTSNDAGHDFYGAKAFYVGEDDFNSVSGANKREADWNFAFSVRQRGNTGASAATTMGGSAGYNLGPVYSEWRSGIITLIDPPSVRLDLQEGDVELPAANYMTFYAHVGQATLDRGFALPSSTTGTYGKPQCGINTSGIHNGWNCDRNAWYLNPDGTPVPEPARPFARPGDQYELRDVDCYDGAIGDTGVGAGTAYYGDSPCV